MDTESIKRYFDKRVPTTVIAGWSNMQSPIIFHVFTMEISGTALHWPKSKPIICRSDKIISKVRYFPAHLSNKRQRKQLLQSEVVAVISYFITQFVRSG